MRDRTPQVNITNYIPRDWLEYIDVRRKKGLIIVGAVSIILIIASIYISIQVILGLVIASVVGWLIRRDQKHQKWIDNLISERIIARLEVLDCIPYGNMTHTKLRFTQISTRGDKRNDIPIVRTLEGEIIHFDAFVLQFDLNAVKEGKRFALFGWRRIYSDCMRPDEGIPIEKNFGELLSHAIHFGLVLFPQKKGLMNYLWRLSTNIPWMKKNQIRTMYGNSVYIRCLPGQIYNFYIDKKGNIYPVLQTEQQNSMEESDE